MSETVLTDSGLQPLKTGMIEAADEPAFGFALARRRVYDEPAFQHFLLIERKRSQISRRPVTLLLVSLRRSPGKDLLIGQARTGAVFAGIEESVREVDFVGWYREEYVAAAVLAHGGELPDSTTRVVISERVTQAIGRRLSPTMAARLRVRVVRLGRA